MLAIGTQRIPYQIIFPLSRFRCFSRVLVVVPGSTGHFSTNYRRGYQLVDNYVVRVLAGKSAWELSPGAVGAPELMVSGCILCVFQK